MQSVVQELKSFEQFFLPVHFLSDSLALFVRVRLVIEPWGGSTFCATLYN